MSLYRNQLECWLKTIHVKTERALDLGGASNPVRNRVGSWQVQDCTFFDLGKEKPVVQYIFFDINLPLTQLKGYEAFTQKDEFGTSEKNPFRFDAIFCLEVFEYVWNPIQAIENIWELMNNDSIVCLSFPAIYPVHNPVEIDYLRFTKQAIQKYLTLFPFTQIEITPRKATKGQQSLAEFYSLEGMHPVRHSELPFNIGYLVKARKLI